MLHTCIKMFFVNKHKEDDKNQPKIFLKMNEWIN